MSSEAIRVPTPSPALPRLRLSACIRSRFSPSTSSPILAWRAAGKARVPIAASIATAAKAGSEWASGKQAKLSPRRTYRKSCTLRAPKRSTAMPATGSAAMPISPVTVSTRPISASGNPVTWRKNTRLNGTYIPLPVASIAIPAARARSPGNRGRRKDMDLQKWGAVAGGDRRPRRLR